MGVDSGFQQWLSSSSAFFSKGSGGGAGKGGRVMDATAIAAASADWAGWQRRALLLDAVDDAQFGRAAWFAAVVCAALVVSHLLAVAFIAHHDISGKWDQYSLKYQRSTVRTYLQHVPSFFTDVAFLLFPALLAFGYFYDAALFEPLLLHGRPARDALRLAALTLAAALNNVVNRLWAMVVHWVMHESKFLYRSVHKRHHCRIKDLCALSAWQDTTLEFVLMEVFGVFLFAQLFNPLPWHFHVLLAAYNGIGGAIDHSAFYIPGTIIDGRYHWDHHVRLDYNYSEIEMLDRMFGTLYERPHDEPAPGHAKAKPTPAVPDGEPGLRPPASDAASSAAAPRLRRKRPLPQTGGEGETRGPPEREGEEEDPLLLLRASEEVVGQWKEEKGKAAQSPPRAGDGPRAGEAGGTVGGIGGKGPRTAQPYS